MFLKQYLRGSILIIFTLAALSVIVTAAIGQALAIVDRINSGEVPLDTESIAELVYSSTSGQSSMLSIAGLVVGACWLAGIIDSYRLGIVQET